MSTIALPTTPEKGGKDAAKSLAEDLTAAVIDALENVTASDWSAPWHNLGATAPTRIDRKDNRDDEHAYAGFNRLWLMMVGQAKGYTSGYWSTSKQWGNVGRKLDWPKAKAEAVMVLRPSQWRTITDVNGDERRIPIGFTAYKVYPYELTTAKAEDAWTPPEVDHDGLSDEERHEAAEHWFARIGRDVRVGGDSAYYAPATDHIGMPTFEQFKSADGYYSTLAHEHVHSTGHDDRTGRMKANRETFKDHRKAYAFEELVAELGACFVQAELGMIAEPRDDHARYIKGWLSALKDDPQFLYKAAAKAEAAVAYLKAEATA